MLDKSVKQPLPSNVSPEEVSKFDFLAEQWWDPNGKFKTALAFNQARTDFMFDAIKRIRGFGDGVSGLSVLDIGCGGGLICEPFAKSGAEVTGIDASAMSIEVARRHAIMSGLNIRYEHRLASQFVEEDTQFDIVVNAEVIEHVPDQQQLTSEACQLVKPGGLLIMATLNRTIKSYLVAILGAEYLLRYLPIGTHDWRAFVTPEELSGWVASRGMDLMESQGFALNPLSGKWRFTSSLAVNYMSVWRKQS
ncbi:bifunctional 2-polyprenyl-6-hydroxyphenol methylase/3-demethylubiquinol 3-O-methyltransferase UbiG [Aestuariibacter sp. AA17]|uniref:Ubiquinone biosynthesis O-methyltransferase n=1 Tax=Fluctibacter corallii TaxID=2984329 RepID=A0ABT3AD25_9ALTE|nr:bifunctional 2-polyprenyl-6-hydroxyphenol methylase/3-demethylubiquinol 3-O-methyltransferase UbiG [Aestuariibacter sp. AA17]MCV2886581.1 bifunctional 2-polyprenyl-6-hydroxyphenol methylase/3-demethylubiquinol 3-O-methyltransferase UbiG [Aestuariibacter sp. AA17]